MLLQKVTYLTSSDNSSKLESSNSIGDKVKTKVDKLADLLKGFEHLNSKREKSKVGLACKFIVTISQRN